MNKISLAFKNVPLEKKYKAFISENYRRLILVLLALLVAMTIYLLSVKVFRSVGDYTLMGIYLGIAVLSYIFYKKLPKVQYMVVLVSGLMLYFVRIHMRMLNIYDIPRESLLMKAYNWALLYTVVQLHLPHFKYAVAFEIGCWAIRASQVNEYLNDEALAFQIIASIYILYFRYKIEKADRVQFQNVNNSIDHLAKFKQLIKSHIPSGILVMENSSKKTPLFVNDEFKSYLNRNNENESLSESEIKHFLKSIKRDKEPTESSSSDSQGELLSLYDIIENLNFEIRKDSDSLKLYGTYQDINNNKRSAEISLLKLPWDNKEAIVLIVHDTTVHEAVILLKAANKNKEEVIGTVSHELRTPLAGIIGILQIMESMCSFNQELRKYIGICQTNASILLSFLNSILDLQQIRANKLKLNVSKINLTKLLNEIKPMFDFQCSFKDIEYRVDIAPNVPKHIFCDKERLTQILINLSGNALKFTFEGSITLGVREDPDDVNSIIFSVSDTGVGIKEEDLNHLFKAFGKLDDKDGINKKGVGLGLMISNTLAIRLNSNKEGILVESELDKGTKFIFSVPIFPITKKDPEDSTDNSVAEEKQVDLFIKPISTSREPNDNLLRMNTSGSFVLREINSFRSSTLIKNEKVVLVDDNAFNLMIAEKLIDKQKLQVKKAYNGQEAIELVKSLNAQGECIRLIFMDCHMPILDGYEATGKLRAMMKTGELPYIPIVALSANNYEQDIKQSLDAGMDDHMCKPLNEHELVRVLDKYK